MLTKEFVQRRFIGPLLVLSALLLVGSHVLYVRASEQQSELRITPDMVSQELRQAQSVFINKTIDGKRMHFDIKDRLLLERLLNSVREGTVIGVYEIPPREYSPVTDYLEFKSASSRITGVEYVSSAGTLLIPYFFYAKEAGPIVLTSSSSQHDLSILRVRAKRIVLRPGADFAPALLAMESDRWLLP